MHIFSHDYKRKISKNSQGNCILIANRCRKNENDIIIDIYLNNIPFIYVLLIHIKILASKSSTECYYYIS